MDRPVFEIAVALVCREGRWLVAKRPPGAHLGGRWEFPGGKCAPRERPADAAVRELREECAVRAVAQRALPRLSCDYGDRIVHITPVVCRWVAGTPQPVASTECRWVTPAELRALEMPAINAQIVRALLEPSE